MKYNFKRAVGLALVMYVTMFVIGLIAMFVSGVESTNIAETPDWFWYLGMVFAVILTWVFSKWYFKNQQLIPSKVSGFWFGLTLVIVSAILDWVTFSYAAPDEAQVDVGMYFGDWRYWIIILLVLGTAKFVGWKTSPPTPSVSM